MALEEYRTHIQELLSERGQRSAQSSTRTDFETQIIFDTKRDHYQLVHVGWKPNGHRNYGCVLHLDIKDGKIWIQHDGTEEGIANALVDKGVPKQDIVLAFHHPSMRKHTEFAVA
ncbi:XisI protein [Leptothoe spongobia]|uniref:XisI protein n=1 Tax=Leptothoe spongobia TAU-MAC 1115 TaxID=1967444 RepID=A0A947DI86_9CYAN|nr:XisI protein [Leptothoe spongobia]MBT9317491.1 XisI protein [Leptothoe spongobia TAU-MAC 1115]